MFKDNDTFTHKWLINLTVMFSKSWHMGSSHKDGSPSSSMFQEKILHWPGRDFPAITLIFRRPDSHVYPNHYPMIIPSKLDIKVNPQKHPGYPSHIHVNPYKSLWNANKSRELQQKSLKIPLESREFVLQGTNPNGAPQNASQSRA